MSTDEIENSYSHYLCFTVSVRTNSLTWNQKYSSRQLQTHNLIKRLHDSGLGYRRIAQQLNAEEIRTTRGNRWKGTHVYSVLKRYRERQDQIRKERNRIYDAVWGKFEVRWLRTRGSHSSSAVE